MTQDKPPEALHALREQIDAIDHRVLERKHVGIYVMIFLGVFLVFAYLLDREYWKNIH